MRIRQIGLRSVLHYEDSDVDFGRRMTGFHVLYGPNETGKSTLLQVMLDLLFGGKLEGSTGREASLAGPARDLYTSPNARIVGVLEAPDGRELPIERKRSRSQLILSEGTMAGITEDVLVNWLGGYDRERFHLLFGFDHDRLRSGGQGLLQSGGHAGISLFEAGGGIAHLQRLLDSLTKQSTELLDTSFRGNSRKRLNQAWLEARTARMQVDHSGLRGEKWHATRTRREDERAIVETLRSEREEVARKIQSAQRVLRIWEQMAERKRLVADCTRLREQPIMDLTAVVAIETLWEKLAQAHTDTERVEASLDSLRRQGAELVVADNLMERASAIQPLLDELSLYRAKKQKDLPGLDQELATIGQKVDSALQRLAPGRGLDDVFLWRLPEDREHVLSRVAKDWQTGKVQRAQAAERLQEHEDLWQSLEAQRLALPDRLDVGDLKRCLERIVRHGDLDKMLSDHAGEIQRVKADLDQRMTRQPVWKGDWRGLVQQAWPLRESVDRYENQWREAQQQVALAESAITQATEAANRLRDELADLQVAGEVPDETQLGALREARDSQWRRICANWLSGAPLADDPYDLAQEYAKGVAAADDMADRLRRDADRSARKLELQRQVERCAKALIDLAEQRERVRTAGDELWQRWVREWPEASIIPLPPLEMRAWMTDHVEKIQELAGRVASLELEQARLGDLRMAWLQEIRCALLDVFAGVVESEATGSTHDKKSYDDLTSLVEQMKQVIGQAERRDVDRHRLGERLAEVDRDRQKWRQTEAKSAADLAAVGADFAALRAEFPYLPAEVEVAVTFAQSLRSLLDTVDRQRHVAHQRDLLQADCASFERRAQELAMDLVQTPPAPEAVAIWLDSLKVQFDEAKRAASAREQLIRQITQQENDLVKRRDIVASHMAALDEHAHGQGLEDRSLLVSRVQQSKAYHEVVAELGRLDEQIARAGDGLTIEQLEGAVVEAVDVPTVQGHITELDAEFAHLEQRIIEHREAVWALDQAFQAMDGQAMEAADQAQQAEFAYGQVDRHWQEYLRVELARRLLQKAIDDFRERNEGAIIASAGVHFTELTLGRYAGLQVEYEENQPFLIARTSDGELRRTGQLSDGTRDQLFLALRLAFVEQHLHSGEPLPMIMDDILVHFDDARAEATLRILSRIAQKTQVIYFTHQRSVFETAQRLGGIDCIDMGDGETLVGRVRMSSG